MISTSEKEVLNLRMKPLMKLDPHAENGGYIIRSLYFDDYWNSAYEEKESGVLMQKVPDTNYNYSAERISWSEKRSSAVIFIRKALHLQKMSCKKSFRRV